LGNRKKGRPPSLSQTKINQIKRGFKKYINETEIPIIVEFAYLSDIPRTVLYDYVEFSTLKEKCIMKKEAQLEKLGLNNAVNPTMAVFSLKQLGWSDKSKEEKKDDAEKLKAFVNGVFGVKTDDD